MARRVIKRLSKRSSERIKRPSEQNPEEKVMILKRESTCHEHKSHGSPVFLVRNHLNAQIASLFVMRKQPHAVAV